MKNNYDNDLVGTNKKKKDGDSFQLTNKEMKNKVLR